MSIQFQHSPTETQIDKVIKKLPYQQTKQQFIQTAIETYIAFKSSKTKSLKHNSKKLN